METKKLYYEDSHQKIFSATVTGCEETAKGWKITLDTTAFYPEGGGQPCDVGRLGESAVLDVQETDGNILHLCDKPLAVGSTVTGEIDWARRFDFMQQHSGEHMVSGVIHALYGYHNVGFHMGAEVVTIDFDGYIPPEGLAEIEEKVNAAIWENLPVKCFYATEETLKTLPYRRKKDLLPPVRLVEFPGIDLCACCGTQVKFTGEIGLVKLLSCVKFHEGVRIEMVCGERATKLLGKVYAQNKQVSQLFSAKILETGEAASRFSESLSVEKLRSAQLEKRLFATIAQTYAKKTLALHFEENLSPAQNRNLCDAIAEQTAMAVTLSGNDKTGYSLCIISRAEDAKALGQQLTARFSGNGGGKKEAFQGSLCATQKEISAFFRHIDENEK